MNLALLQQYGPNAWRIHNFLLEQNAKNLEKTVEDLKQLTVEVNRERKNFQVRPSIAVHYWRQPLILQFFTLDPGWHPAHDARDPLDRAHLERPTDRDGKRRARSRDRQAQ